MKSQITMKDIADHFGMSLNTVHKAIAGKPGIGDATRASILEYAEKNGYQRNTMASILKRKQLTLALCLPQLDQNSRYFYHDIWTGCRKYLEEWPSLNLQVREIPFPSNGLSKSLSSIASECEQGCHIDGLLTVPPKDDSGISALKKIAERGTAIVFVTEDNPQCGRLGAVTGDYYATGQLMAEQICNILKGQGQIYLLAGDEYNDAHYLTAKGFHEYIRQNHNGFTVTNLYGSYETSQSVQELSSLLDVKKPDAALSVFARGSAALCTALRKSDLAGKIPAIANDLFPENIEALKDGIFTNLIFKDPYRQAYLAIKMLCEYLLKETIPEKSLLKVEGKLIFRSNLKYYYH